MIDLEKLKGEYTVLSYLVTCAERARDVIRRAPVNESMFTSGENRAAFIALMAADAIAGAALAKRIGSESYGLWTDAIIKLTDFDGTARCKAADDIVSALPRIWADFRIWIYMNPPHNEKKSKERSKKSKK